MKTVEKIGSVKALVKAARNKGRRIGFVPTMGALHEGHVSLIKAAKSKAGFVVVSIFVNPIQFAPGEDFKKYPRNLKRDLRICKDSGVDVVFAPTAGQMYSTERLVWVSVEKLADQLCGRTRPGHFRGVTTVCAKLFNIVGPDFAFFGQKDAQQAIIIERMVADLNMPLKIVICPTVRQKDGLALSSRNRYLTERQEKDATCIYRSLRKARELIEGGVDSARTIIRQMRMVLNKVPSIKIEYVSVVDARTLQVIDKIRGSILIAVAVRIGRARLIDNIMLEIPAK